jgi:hypothetical protein
MLLKMIWQLNQPRAADHHTCRWGEVLRGIGCRECDVGDGMWGAPGKGGDFLQLAAVRGNGCRSHG